MFFARPSPLLEFALSNRNNSFSCISISAYEVSDIPSLPIPLDIAKSSLET